MARDNIFQGLPPPSAKVVKAPSATQTRVAPPPPAISPPPALKSVLKRDKPSVPKSETVASPQKRLRFKITVDAMETQVIEAMQKIASHIKNPSKFSTASKLALQLFRAGSVKEANSGHFFSILEAAMESPTTCTDPSLRADYHALFSAVQDVSDCFNKQQKYQFSTWIIRAVVANDLLTDDSFVFSKAAGQIKEAICGLPVATENDDVEEAAALAKDEDEVAVGKDQEPVNFSSSASPDANKKEESDPFGLDALIAPSISKKDERARGKKETTDLSKTTMEESKRSLKL